MHTLCEADKKAMEAYVAPALAFQQSLLRDTDEEIIKGAEGEYLERLKRHQERVGGRIKELTLLKSYFRLDI